MTTPEAQVHILVGCADARHVGQAHIDAVRANTADIGSARERGGI